MKNQYYSLEKNDLDANINIYGDISSYEYDGSVSLRSLSAELDSLGDVSKINVYINSYGGEVAEGLAIYNALKRHKAHVVTYCDGFAASIASVIFMAGDERIMNESSLLMIHNAWTIGQGNSQELRKLADDLEKITQASIAAYKSHSTLEESEIKALMDAETWILPEEAMEYGFATKIDTDNVSTASQRARMSLCKFVKERTKPTVTIDATKLATCGVYDGVATISSLNDWTEITNVSTTVNTRDDRLTALETAINTAMKSDAVSTEEPETVVEETQIEETEENKPAEMLSGLFNAILKM